VQYSFVFMAFTLLAPGCLMQLPAKSPSSPFIKDVPTVAYCELMQHPELYDQKTIRTKAIYRYGYEWSQLYCPNCLTLGDTWVDFEESIKLCTKSTVSKKIGDNGFRGRTVEVLIVGKF
jgi:hypothetical protein